MKVMHLSKPISTEEESQEQEKKTEVRKVRKERWRKEYTRKSKKTTQFPIVITDFSRACWAQAGV